MEIHNRIIDEMEVAIIKKAALTAWISLEVCLFVFTFVYSFSMQRFDLISAIPLVLAIVSLVVFFISKVIFTNELTKDEWEENEE